MLQDKKSVAEGAARLSQLDQILQGQKKLLIVVHNNPDPDSLACALALRYLAQERSGVRSSIAYGGLIGRTENRALVRELRIPLKNINQVRFSAYDRIALVDTQPGAGNNSLASGIECHIVIDHHPQQRHLKSAVTMIDTKLGAAATILIELLMESKLALYSDMATALAYAIRSETQDLGREAHERDIRAYLEVYPRASMRKLARIANPKLPRSFFIMLAKTLDRTVTFRHLICVHLGEVLIPEMVAQAADFLLRHERMSWSFCSGRFRGQLILSLRSSNRKAKSGKIIKRLVPERSNAGGHEMFAGGRISLEGLDEQKIEQLEEQLSRQFAACLGYKKAEWKPLLPPQ